MIVQNPFPRAICYAAETRVVPFRNFVRNKQRLVMPKGFRDAGASHRCQHHHDQVLQPVFYCSILKQQGLYRFSRSSEIVPELSNAAWCIVKTGIDKTIREQNIAAQPRIGDRLRELDIRLQKGSLKADPVSSSS